MLQAGFTITGVVVDADYGANAAFRAGLERLGLPYGVSSRASRRGGRFTRGQTYVSG